MKKVLSENKTFLLILGMLFLPFIVSASTREVCSRNGYTVISLNGMLTTPEGAVYNRDAIERVISQDSYKGQEIFVDHVYNATHNFVVDFADSALQKMSEGLVSQTYDLTNMISDLSKKVNTQKLLFVAHSQGNFYANDIYNSIGDKQGGVAKKSMGIYGVGTPTSYIAGNGKYILSSNDKIVNLVRLQGILKVLPANVNIEGREEEGDDPDGHKLTSIYLKYQNKRIASEILTMLHELKEDEAQNEDEVCIDEPEITNLHKLMGVFYYVSDPVSKIVKDTFNIVVDTIGGTISKRVWKIGNKIGNVINDMMANALDGVVGGRPTPPVSFSDLSKDENQEELFEEDNENKEEERSDEKGQNDEEEIKTDLNKEEIKNNPETILVLQNKKVTYTRSGGGSSGSSNEEENKETDSDTEENTEDEEKNEEEQASNLKDDFYPIITLLGENPFRIAKGSNYLEPGATVLDNIDSNLKVVITENINTSKVGNYTVLYTATDSSGNVSTKERTVEIYNPLPGLIISEDTTLLAGEYYYDNLTITNNATLKLESNLDMPSSFKGVKIFASNITIDPGASISADGEGYLNGHGTSPVYLSGGSHGGKGERATEEFIYGSAIEPTDLGSGGSSLVYFNTGGGAMYIEVEDTFLNNGNVRSNGYSNSSGGSVYVKTENLEGSGTFQANGGGFYAPNVFWGIGGGGRVAVHYQNSNFKGVVEAEGGKSSYDGFSMTKAEDGTAGLFDDKNNDLYIKTSWEFLKEDEDRVYDNVYVSDWAEVRTEKGAKINIKNFEIKNSSTFTLAGEEDFNIDKISLLESSSVKVLTEVILRLEARDIFIDNLSFIDANATGYEAGPGSPSPENYYQAGASYGGRGSGGDKAKDTYGDKDAPLDFGSGAENSRAGGAIHIISDGEILNNGTITAISYRNRSSGGSVYIEGNKFGGDGKVLAYGQNGAWPYPDLAGGGGRVAIYYNENNFTGEVDVSGGDYCFYGCAKVAEDGTIVWKDKNATPETLSSEKDITSFVFADFDPDIVGLINTDYTINATVPADSNLDSLVPTISISSKATIDKGSGVAQDFTSSFTYKVTAEDGSFVNYVVNVFKQGVEIPVDDIPPLVTSYSLNGTTEEIEIDPTEEGLEIILNSNEDVDWVSVKIENESNSNIRKIFYSGINCEDGGTYCLKNWNGSLSTSASLEEGIYRIIVRIKDLASNETFYILPVRFLVVKKE